MITIQDAEESLAPLRHQADLLGHSIDPRLGILSERVLSVLSVDRDSL